MAGAFDILGSACLGIAFSKGPGGLVQALVLIQCVVQLGLSAMVGGLVPNFRQLLGFIFGLDSALILFLNEQEEQDLKEAKKNDDHKKVSKKRNGNEILAILNVVAIVFAFQIASHEQKVLTLNDKTELFQKGSYTREAIDRQIKYCEADPKIPKGFVSVDIHQPKYMPEFSITVKDYDKNSDVIDVVSQNIIERNVWEMGNLQWMVQNLYRVQEQYPTKKVAYIDIGANLGWFSLGIASLGF